MVQIEGVSFIRGTLVPIIDRVTVPVQELFRYFLFYFFGQGERSTSFTRDGRDLKLVGITVRVNKL